mgnify:CR=1 FL=1
MSGLKGRARARTRAGGRLRLPHAAPLGLLRMLSQFKFNLKRSFAYYLLTACGKKLPFQGAFLNFSAGTPHTGHLKSGGSSPLWKYPHTVQIYPSSCVFSGA